MIQSMEVMCGNVYDKSINAHRNAGMFINPPSTLSLLLLLYKHSCVFTPSNSSPFNRSYFLNTASISAVCCIILYLQYV